MPLPSSGATFEWSIPALAITKPSRCSTIIRFGRCRTMRRDFGQDDFDKTGVLLDLGGERPGLRRRLDRGDIDEAALGLRDDLLRDDEHVAVLGRDPGLGIGGKRNRGEIVAHLDERHAAEAGDGQLGGHGSV